MSSLRVEEAIGTPCLAFELPRLSTSTLARAVSRHWAADLILTVGTGMFLVPFQARDSF